MKKEVSPVLLAVIIVILVVVAGAVGYKMFTGKPALNKAEDEKHMGQNPMSNMTPEKMKAMGEKMKAGEDEMARKAMQGRMQGGAPAEAPGGR